MNLNQWDAEAASIANDLAAIKSHQQDPFQKERLGLISMKVGIFQLQTRLSAVLDKLTVASQKSTLIPNHRIKSLLHWSNIYAEKTQHYYFQLVQLLGKKMWLKLIRTRMPGTQGDLNANVSDENLVELSIRHKQLADTELLLREQLAVLLKEKESLKHQYGDVCAIQANREAAGTMQAKFGRDLAEALKHPLIHKLKDTFTQLALAARPVTKRYHYMLDLHQNISQQADVLIQNCKKQVLEDLFKPQSGNERVRNREYDASLRQITELRSQLALTATLFQPRPSVSHPVIKQ